MNIYFFCSYILLRIFLFREIKLSSPYDPLKRLFKPANESLWFIDFFFTDSKSLSGKRPKSAYGKSSSCRFSFSAARNAISKATEHVTFGFYFRTLVSSSLLGKFESHRLWAIRIFKCFSRHNSRTFRQTTLYWESWRLFHSFNNLIEWREKRVTYQQLIGDIKHTWKNIVFFHMSYYGFSHGWKSLYNTIVYMINLHIKYFLFLRRHPFHL